MTDQPLDPVQEARTKLLDHVEVAHLRTCAVFRMGKSGKRMVTMSSGEPCNCGAENARHNLVALFRAAVVEEERQKWEAEREFITVDEVMGQAAFDDAMAAIDKAEASVVPDTDERSGILLHFLGVTRRALKREWEMTRFQARIAKALGLNPDDATGEEILVALRASDGKEEG